MAYFLSKEELDKLQHAEREDLSLPHSHPHHFQ